MLRVLALCSLVLLTACDGGFQAIKPDPNQIIAIRNQSLKEAQLDIRSAEPTPLPVLPPLETQPGPFTQPPPDPSPVNPRGMETPTIGPLGTPQQVNPNDPPYRPFGKLVYTINNKSFECSGELVGSTGDVLMTAAHCVYDNKANIWGSNFTFLLGYDNGNYRQQFDWQCSAIFTGWSQGGWEKDYAFIKLRGSAPQALGMRVGLPGSNWASIGYPSNFANGQRLHRVEGTRGTVSGGVVQMVGNPFGKGSSGGAWVDGSFAIGVNSFTRSNETERMWGPLFDGRTTQLYEYVRRGCQDDVIPLGQSPRVALYDKTKAYIETVTDRVEYGPKITQSKTAACPCQDAEEIFIENDGPTGYLTELEYAGTTVDSKVVSSDTLQIRSESRKRESLG